MVEKRTDHSEEFKSEVALAAIKGHKTISELAKEYSLHPNQITRWKQEAEKNFAKVFSKNTAEKKELRAVKKELERAENQIGKTTLENAWLKKKLAPYS